MYVYEYLKKAADVIFPPEHEELLVRALSAHDMMTLRHPNYVREFLVLADFTDERIRALIHEAKFHANTRAAELLGHMLAAHFRATRVDVRNTVFIPIPLSPARFRERGYNQVLEVLRSAEKECAGMCIASDALIRKKNTLPQTELTKDERERNLADAFSVAHPEAVRGKNIILVDDVVTTGATMRAARGALLSHNPLTISCIALAH